MQYLYKMPGTGLCAERHFAFYEVKLILKPRGKKYRMLNGNNWKLNGDFVKQNGSRRAICESTRFMLLASANKMRSNLKFIYVLFLYGKEPKNLDFIKFQSDNMPIPND